MSTTHDRREATADSPRKRDVRALAEAALELLGHDWPSTREDAAALVADLREQRTRPVSWEQVREAAAEAVRGTWGDPGEIITPDRATRTTDRPRDDLRRYLEGITGSTPGMTHQEHARRYLERGGGASYKRKQPRGSRFDQAAAELEAQLLAGEGTTDPLVLTYAYHVARSYELEARQDGGDNDIPF